MNISPVYSQGRIRSVQLLHLRDSLQRRIASAQGNPALLALLSEEASVLGFADRQATATRLDRTLAALRTLRVEH